MAEVYLLDRKPLMGDPYSPQCICQDKDLTPIPPWASAPQQPVRSRVVPGMSVRPTGISWCRPETVQRIPIRFLTRSHPPVLRMARNSTTHNY